MMMKFPKTLEEALVSCLHIKYKIVCFPGCFAFVVVDDDDDDDDDDEYDDDDDDDDN